MVQEFFRRAGENWGLALGMVAVVGSMVTVAVQVGSYERTVQVNTIRIDVLERQIVELRESDARQMERLARLEGRR
jgi:hypothetical protein